MSFLTRLISLLMKGKKARKRLRRVNMTLASVIVFITVYMLILPAISIERETALEKPGIFLSDGNALVEDENNGDTGDYDDFSGDDQLADDQPADAGMSEILIDNGSAEDFPLTYVFWLRMKRRI